MPRVPPIKTPLPSGPSSKDLVGVDWPHFQTCTPNAPSLIRAGLGQHLAVTVPSSLPVTACGQLPLSLSLTFLSDHPSSQSQEPSPPPLPRFPVLIAELCALGGCSSQKISPFSRRRRCKKERVLFLRQMKASRRRCVLDPPTCVSPPPSASKGRLSECEMNPGPPVCSRRKGSWSFRHNISFMAALLLLPLAQHRLRCLLDLLKVTPRSSPLCLSQEPARS